MKKMIFVILLPVFLASCKKQNEFQAEGTLTGVDYALCLCCGGVVLTIDNQTGNFRIDSLPYMTNEQLYSMVFPKRIKFNYRIQKTCGSIETVLVSEYFIQ